MERGRDRRARRDEKIIRQRDKEAESDLILY